MAAGDRRSAGSPSRRNPSSRTSSRGTPTVRPGSSARRPAERRPAQSRPDQGATPRTSSRFAIPGADSTAAQSWRRAKGSTRRLAILGGIVIVLAIMLVPTIRAYLGQRDEYAALAEKVRQQQSRVAELSELDKKWSDPAYIEQEARRRLNMAAPGEKTYILLPVDGLATGKPGIGHGAVVAPNTTKEPWYSQVWDTIVTTDQGKSSDTVETTPIDPNTAK